MVTNFFQALAGLQVQADWQLCISMNEGQMTASVLLRNERAADDARKVIPPMILKGTPADLDNGFFTAIETPAKETDKLFSNMEAYQQAQAAAKKQSKMGQGSADKEKQEKEEAKKQKAELKKQYDERMKAVAALEEQKQYKEAIALLPDSSEFPDYADEINKRSLELLQKNISPGLF